MNYYKDSIKNIEGQNEYKKIPNENPNNIN